MFARLKHLIWWKLGCNAQGLRLISLYAACKGKDIGATARDTEIVIEGFPRSANTYAYVAFMLAQNRPMRVAHHVHGPAQFEVALRFDIPCVMLIRDPVDAVISMAIRDPRLNPGMLMREYVQFYRRVERIAEHVVIADFSAVTECFDLVIEEVNQRFSKEFLLPRADDRFQERVRKKVLAMDEADRGGQSERAASTAALPNSVREREKPRIRERIVSLLDDADCAEAAEVFSRLQECAVRSK